jgi:hypothetical protein
VVFIQISTDVSSALKIFETINERGVGLNPMDLLKNLLFTQVKQAQFTQLKDEWKKITKPLEKEKEKPLRFLRYFLMANYVIKNERGDAVVREDEIYDWFIAKDNAALCDYAGKPFEFVRKVIRNVEHYLAFANGLGNDGKPSLAMDSLKRLAGGAFSLHYVLLLAAANFPKPLFDHFVAQLESFLFYYIFTKTPTKDLERSFSQWADELRAIAETTDPVKQKVQLNAIRCRPLREEHGGQVAGAGRCPQALHAVLDAAVPDALPAGAADAARRDGVQRVKVPGSLEPFTNLEIEHILPNKPERTICAASGPQRTRGCLRRLQEPPPP